MLKMRGRFIPEVECWTCDTLCS